MRIPIPARTDEYVRREFSDKDAWLHGRVGSIGASEVPIILGIAPTSWGNARELWAEKTGRVPHNDIGNEDTRRGQMAEPHIRELFAIRHPDLKVYDGTNCIFRSRKYPWLSCSLDMIIVDGKGDCYVGEIKAVRYTAHWKGDDYPMWYRYQCIAQLLVTGWKGAILIPNISYDFGGGRTWLDSVGESTVRERHIVIRRSEVRGQFAGIVRETKAFHESIVNGTEPEVIIGR